MAHMVIAEDCIHYHSSPFWICGGQSDSGTGFLPWVFQFSLIGIIPPTLPTHLFVSHKFYSGFTQSLDFEHYPPHSHTWWRFIFI